MSGESYHPETGVVYNSKKMYDLAYFVARLHDPILPSIVKEVRYISTNVPSVLM